MKKKQIYIYLKKGNIKKINQKNNDIKKKKYYNC